MTDERDLAARAADFHHIQGSRRIVQQAKRDGLAWQVYVHWHEVAIDPNTCTPEECERAIRAFLTGGEGS